MKKLLTPMYEGRSCKVEINGKVYTRIVRYNRMDGLFIVIKNRKYFEYEFEYEF